METHEHLLTDRLTETGSEREDTWERLAGVNKELFIRLYGSQDAFLNPGIVFPLEQYIIEFDNNMSDEGIVRQLAFRLGAEIPRNADAPVFFYWVLSQVVDTFGISGQAGNNIPTLREIVNMTHSEYYRGREEEIYTYKEQFGPYYEDDELRTTDTYHQRLLLFLDKAKIGD